MEHDYNAAPAGPVPPYIPNDPGYPNTYYNDKDDDDDEFFKDNDKPKQKLFKEGILDKMKENGQNNEIQA